MKDLKHNGSMKALSALLQDKVLDYRLMLIVKLSRPTSIGAF
jgi:hypothetical protein